ncbi:peroxin [Chytriomyces hyalinus]|nr:peroxin [Chytriomyces hyalinus]
MARKRSLVGRVLIAGVAIAGCGFAAFKYAMHKMESSERERAQLRTAKNKLALRFSQLQSDCTSTVSRSLTLVSKQIYPLCDVERITAQLQQMRADPSAYSSPEDAKRIKRELWEDLKIASNAFYFEYMTLLHLTLRGTGFTRTLAAIYILNLLNCFSHMQLNIIGRHTLLPTISDSVSPIPSETEIQFLSFTYFLLQIGQFELISRVKAAIESEFLGTSVSEDISCGELVAHLVNIRLKVEEIEGGFSSFMLPIEGAEDDMLQGVHENANVKAFSQDPILRGMVAELRDLTDSPDFSNVLKQSLDKTFAVLELHLKATLYPSQMPPEQVEKISEITDADAVDKKIKLAHVLPVVSRFSGEVLASSDNKILAVEFFDLASFAISA